MLGGDFDEYIEMVFLGFCVDMSGHENYCDLEDMNKYLGTCFTDYGLFLLCMYNTFQFVVYH